MLQPALRPAFGDLPLARVIGVKPVDQGGRQIVRRDCANSPAQMDGYGASLG
jgi:hypothetical protein